MKWNGKKAKRMKNESIGKKYKQGNDGKEQKKKRKRVKNKSIGRKRKINEITYPFVILLYDKWICQKKKKKEKNE